MTSFPEEINYHEKVMGEYLGRYRSGFTEGWMDQFADAPNLVSTGEFTRPFRHGYEDGRTEAVLIMEAINDH